ncbi:MAG TPA: hypothetical protein VNB64_09585 [Solirubrobacteraceae bacterium]|nr:hypothetical protein [Solirubrobacteraceae bacterium]
MSDEAEREMRGYEGSGKLDVLVNNIAYQAPTEELLEIIFASQQLSSYPSGEVLAPIGGETLPG